MRYSVVIATLFIWVLSGAGAEAYYLDTPHNESNGIVCTTCHSSAPFYVTDWAARTAANPDDTRANAVCLMCHDPASTDPHKGPAMALHSSSTIPGATTWSTECIQCHDQHAQGQLDWNTTNPDQLFLATGSFRTIASIGGSPLVYTPGTSDAGYTTVGISPTIIGDPQWTNVTTWSTKGGNQPGGNAVDGSRGLILVPNKGNPNETFEIIDVTPTTINGRAGYLLKVKGQMAQDAFQGGVFGVIYGAALRSTLMPNGGAADTDYRDVKFFFPGLKTGTHGGYVDLTPNATQPVGLCQVCHTATTSWREDGTASGHHPDTNCRNCHDLLAGGGANTAPVANGGPDQEVATGSLVTLNGSASSDADSDPLTYTWTLVSRPATSNAALVGGATIGPTFTADVAGTYVVSLVVNDGKVDSAADTVSITAVTPNHPPVAEAGPDQDVIISAPVMLNGSASSDADGDPLTYSWSFTSRPAGSNAALAGVTSVNPTFTPDVVGSYVVRLVVNDGKVNSGADSVTITVNPPPVVPTISAGATPAAFFRDSGQESTRISWSTTNAMHIYLQRQGSGQSEFEVFGSYYDDSGITATTTYTVRAVSSTGNSATTEVTVKVMDPLTLGVAITSPVDMAVLTRPTTRVEGLVTNGGAEIGVTVNGIPTKMVGTTFFLENLALAEGANTLTAMVTNAAGATDTSSITVTCNPNGQEWLDLSLNPESGVADPGAIPPKPFTSTLKVTPHLAKSLVNWSWGWGYGYTGYGSNPEPLTLDSYSSDGFELQLSFSDPGVYTLYYTLYDNDTGLSYPGEIMVNVLDKSELDGVLKQQWDAMKSALVTHDVEGGLSYFLESSQDNYREVFNGIADLPGKISQMQAIQMVYADTDRVKYRITRDQSIGGIMTTITYYIYFVRDRNGLWKIAQF